MCLMSITYLHSLISIPSKKCNNPTNCAINGFILIASKITIDVCVFKLFCDYLLNNFYKIIIFRFPVDKT